MSDSSKYRKRDAGILKFISVGCLAGVVVVVLALGVTGNALAQADQGLFQLTRDPKVIALQIRSALAPAERGLQVISRSADQGSVDAAVKSIRESYRYLRAAQQGSEMALSRSSFPDPLMRLRNDHIWQIRLRLLKCVDNGPRLTDADGAFRAICIESLTEGIRRLHVLVMTLP
jgi:hypothetical protein